MKPIERQSPIPAYYQIAVHLRARIVGREWQSGELRPQAGEIEDARWFEVLQLPKLPSKISIARRLIDAVSMEIRRKFETGA